MSINIWDVSCRAWLFTLMKERGPSPLTRREQSALPLPTPSRPLAGFLLLWALLALSFSAHLKYGPIRATSDRVVRPQRQLYLPGCICGLCQRVSKLLCKWVGLPSEDVVAHAGRCGRRRWGLSDTGVSGCVSVCQGVCQGVGCCASGWGCHPKASWLMQVAVVGVVGGSAGCGVLTCARALNPPPPRSPPPWQLLLSGRVRSGFRVCTPSSGPPWRQWH
jgi:hypothetical protein